MTTLAALINLYRMKELADQRIFVAGHRGMVGSAVCRRLAEIPCQVLTAGRDELNLCDAPRTLDFFRSDRPTMVVFAAARVGGIVANNTFPVEFLADNVLMAVHAIQAAFQAGVGRFLFLGSTCIYPRDAEQPIRRRRAADGTTGTDQ